jgi:hypothetical protein
MKSINHLFFIPFILMFLTMFFPSKLNPDKSEFSEITKNTTLPLLTDLQSNEYETSYSEIIKKIIWVYLYWKIINYYPEKNNYKFFIFVLLLLHLFIFDGKSFTEKKLIFNFSVHMVYTIIVISFIVLYKYRFQKINIYQLLTICCAIFIMYEDKTRNLPLCNNFVYLQWIIYFLEIYTLKNKIFKIPKAPWSAVE